MTIYINGRFLTKPITGVQRYAIEIVKQFDKNENKHKIVILLPKGDIVTHLKLSNVEIKQIGKLSGNLWEQISLPIFMRKQKNAVLLNLCNIGPILYPGYTTIHDIAFKTYSAHLNWKFALYYRIITKLNIKRYDYIFTASKFSKNEILENYHVDENKIAVTYNSAEHLKNIAGDDTLLKKLNLEKKDFIFSLGSKSPHKNHKFIEKCAKENPDILFVVAGDNSNGTFKDEKGEEEINNLIFTGRLNDAQMKSFYSKCNAFIFPSLYEGFGIPPLEAIQCGCSNIILSDIDVFKEIYGDNVKYIKIEDEENEAKKIKNIINKKIDINYEKIKHYSWKNAFNIIIEKINKNIEENNK
jgi:glycosyltransferase involved in cell wall biosynthesis